MQIEFALGEISKEEIESIAELYRPAPGISKISRKTKERLFAIVCIIYVMTVSFLLTKQFSTFTRALISVISFIILFILVYFLLAVLQSNREQKFLKEQISSFGRITEQGFEFHSDTKKKFFQWNSIYACKYSDTTDMILFTPSSSQIFLPRFFRSRDEWLKFVEVVKRKVIKKWNVRDY